MSTNPNDKASDLTKLEYFAGLAMQGAIASASADGVEYNPERGASWSKECAEALITELNKAESAPESAPKFDVGDTVKANDTVELRGVIAKVHKVDMTGIIVLDNGAWVTADDLTLIAKGKP